jgi:hypothetical protein
MRQRHIKASEVRSFAFCERAWHFERTGIQSALEKERARGEIDHQEQGRAAVKRPSCAASFNTETVQSISPFDDPLRRRLSNALDAMHEAEALRDVPRTTIVGGDARAVDIAVTATNLSLR